MKFFPSLCLFVLALAAASCMKDDTDRTVFVSAADNSFMTAISYANHNEMETGKIALTNAGRDSVKIFGQTMIKEHSGAQSGVDSMAKQLKISIPQTADTAHLAIVKKLLSLSGHAFDSAYMRLQLDDHQNTIYLLEDELKNGSNQQVKDFAAALLPEVRTHYNMAVAIGQ